MPLYCTVPNPNSEIHSAEAVPGAQPVGETGLAASLPSLFLTLNLPALWVGGGATDGAAATLPNTGAGGGNPELAGAPRIAAYPGGGPGGNVPVAPPTVTVGNELPSAAGTAPPAGGGTAPTAGVGIAPTAGAVAVPPAGIVAVPPPAAAFC